MCSVSPVINGCSAKCCENFPMPFSPEDFIANDKAIEIGNFLFTKSSGIQVQVIRDPTRQIVQDMIVHLGLSQVSPETPFCTIGEEYRYKHCIPDDEPLVQSQLKTGKDWLTVIDGELYINTYTCRHFDIVNRICTIYETRPNMCRNFGRGCKHASCSFDALLKQEQEKEHLEALYANNFKGLKQKIENYEFDDETYKKSSLDTLIEELLL
jgi:Fe-S-cluster containining protein